LSFEEYRKKHYQKQFGEARRILAEVTNGVDSEAFKIAFPVLLTKMWTPEKYLHDDWLKEQKRNQVVSGAPGQAGPEPPEKLSSHLPRERQVSSRQPTQTIVWPDEYVKFIDTTETRWIQLNQYVSKEDWNGMNEIAKQYGYTKWNSKGRRWEKQ